MPRDQKHYALVSGATPDVGVCGEPLNGERQNWTYDLKHVSCWLCRRIVTDNHYYPTGGTR